LILLLLFQFYKKKKPICSFAKKPKEKPNFLLIQFLQKIEANFLSFFAKLV
jgi:hypothetical protein